MCSYIDNVRFQYFLAAALSSHGCPLVIGIFFIFTYFILQAISLMKQFSSTDPGNTNYLTFVTFLSG
jgi:hypothetical protein